MSHVLKTKLNVENFRCLTALIKVYKETIHKVGASTDGPHAKMKFLKYKVNAFDVSLTYYLKVQF